MLEITAKKYYGDNVVLDVENLFFEKGKKYALIGANGSGKSTLLKLIDKHIKAKNQELSIDKQVIIGYMPQTTYAFDFSVKRNIMLTCKISNRKSAKYRADNLIKDLQLEKFKNKNATRLSGGELQRVALARTLMLKCDLLLLDEPTSAMDVEQSKNVIEFLKNETDFFNMTLIFATHSLKQAESLADYVIFMSKGKIIEIIEAKDFMSKAKTKELIEFISAF